ncbi:MAG TPA: FAD:protein FMN transferase [Aquabacterium sp.]|uniref:FAD:protein FMN transferase n=1 Tax=Aquabacterium sp. TaxID=1872578 RepID=UPI002E2FBAE9|nr:FAD:protein FMN transferase [Aquabacterium sp.]HEX5354704.1 FAD:protein FMN transferase [Aquabacterium sp.]
MSLVAWPPHEGVQWVRRARPVLGTLVDIGVPAGAEAALQAAFEVMQLVQRHMSVFESGSDLRRSLAAEPGQPVALHPWTAEVLQFAQTLHVQSAGLFDVALGSGSWQLDRQGDDCFLIRHRASTRIDLGGLAKGWAVDKAVEAALAHGASAIWVNAGGDLRVQGLTLPVVLRDELSGGVRPWAELQDGALATSDFRPGARSRLTGQVAALHLSVLAPRCAWADALTKVLAQCPELDQGLAHDLLQHYQAQAWVHDPT